MPDQNQPRDDLQALLLTILRRRGGEPVTYAELQSSGIEFPASLVAELELANVEIVRCRVTGSGERPVPAVRLPSAAKEPPVDLGGGRDREPPQVMPSAGWGPLHVYRGSRLRALGAAVGRQSGAHLGPPAEKRRSRRLRERPHASRRPRTRILVLLVLLAGIAVVATVLVVGTAGGNPGPHLSSQSHPTRGAREHAGSARSGAQAGHAGMHRPTASVPGQTTTAAPQAPRLPATPVSPSRAATLEAQGHSLLAAGESAAAVSILERAVASTGEHPSACVEPTTQNCLTYAYALFDLGRALQLTGHASAAIAVLEQRLKIDNQRPQVAAELASVRRS